MVSLGTLEALLPIILWGMFVSGMISAVCVILAVERYQRRTRPQQLDRFIVSTRPLLESIPDAVIILSPELTIRAWNPAATGIYGYSEKEVVGKRITAVIPEVPGTMRPERPDRLLSEGKTWQGRFTCYTQGGQMVTVSSMTTVLRTRGGEIFGFIGVDRNITEQAHLEQQYMYQATLLSAVQDAMIAMDRHFRITEWNEAATTLYGFSSAEAIGHVSTHLLRTEKSPDQIFSGTMVDRGIWQGRLTHFTKTGKPVNVSSNISWLYDEDGRLTGYLAVDRDITAQVEAEHRLTELNANLGMQVEAQTQELRREQAQLRALLDAMTEGVLDLENNEIRFANRAMSRLTGYTLGELIGLPHAQFFNRNMLKAPNTGRLIEDIQQPFRGQTAWRRKDGTSFQVALTLTRVPAPMTSPEDKPIHREVLIVRDLTEEKQLETQRSSFIAHASHELRTPLTNLKTRLYLLRKHPDQLDEHMSVIERVTARMMQLVEELLDIARFERGVITLYKELFDLRNVVTEVIDTQRPEADKKLITIHYTSPPRPVMVKADPDRLMQVVVNLLINAINYTHQRGQIHITIGISDDQATIRVNDNGEGIAPENLPRIFDPFFRASEGKSRGTGLGLSISKQIMELHGGVILAESQPREGSTFTVRLPCETTGHGF